MTTAHQHPDIYRRLGIEVGRLGCIMLDTSPIDLGNAIAPEDYYRSEHPDRGWIGGPVAEDGAHITLLYGLLTSMWPGPDEYAADVAEVLHGWSPPRTLRYSGVEVFPSTFEDEAYSCIVLRMEPAGLDEANRRLTLLPHVQTFTEYKPHLTLAYVRRDATDRVTASLATRFDRFGAKPTIVPAGLNFGSVRRWEQSKATA